MSTHPDPALVRTVDAVDQARGLPPTIVTGDRPEVVGRARDEWERNDGVQLAPIQLGRP